MRNYLFQTPQLQTESSLSRVTTHSSSIRKPPESASDQCSAWILRENFIPSGWTTCPAKSSAKRLPYQGLTVLPRSLLLAKWSAGCNGPSISPLNMQKHANSLESPSASFKLCSTSAPTCT